MAIPVESQGEPAGGAGRPDYQRRLVPLLGGAVAAMALGCVIAPQVEKALDPNAGAALPIQNKLRQAIRLEGELRAAMTAVGMHVVDKLRQCGQEAPPTIGQEMRLAPALLQGRRMVLLEGCWGATAAIKNARSGEDLAIEVCYSIQDPSTYAILEPGGNRCASNQAAVTVRPTELVMEARSTLQCGDGKAYDGPRITCLPGPDFVAECKVQTGPTAFIPTRFTRKK